jgi:hypothetical protein
MFDVRCWSVRFQRGSLRRYMSTSLPDDDEAGYGGN